MNASLSLYLDDPVTIRINNADPERPFVIIDLGKGTAQVNIFTPGFGLECLPFLRSLFEQTADVIAKIEGQAIAKDAMTPAQEALIQQEGQYRALGLDAPGKTLQNGPHEQKTFPRSLARALNEAHETRRVQDERGESHEDFDSLTGHGRF